MLFIAKMAGVCAVLLACSALSLLAQRITFSAPMEVTHGKPYVMVMVNGRGPFRFVVDTGTGGEALVTPQLADRLGLPEVGQVRLNDPSGQGRQRAPLVLVDSLEVAGVEFTGIRAIRHRLDGEEDSCMGLLGFTLFRDYLLTLDYPSRRLMLESGALAAESDGSVVPFRMPQGVPIATLDVDDMKIEAQLDSGGSGLSFPEKVASRLKFATELTVFGKGQSLSTSYQVKAARLAQDVRLGGYTFAQPFVEINPAFPLANFGSCPMHNFALTFDQKSLLVRFAANRKLLRLDTTPTALHMEHAPIQKPADIALVPVG
jgi:predicted aspartyl protease